MSPIPESSSPLHALQPQGSELVMPASRVTIYLTLFTAYTLTILPWHSAILWLLPDFTLLVLAYWNIHAPRRVGLGAAFILGILSDVSHGMVLGLNALVYCLASLVVISVHRRLLNFAPTGQMLQLVPVFIGKQAILLAVGPLFGLEVLDWLWLVSGLVTALLWVPTVWLLDLARQLFLHLGKQDGPHG